MTLAMFKLESFSAARGGHAAEAVFSREAVDQAYASGVADGQARKEDEQMRHLGAGLDRLSRALADDEARRATLRAEAVAALAPILDAILDSLTPAHDSRRLEQALRDELGRLAQLATPLRARIACSPQLRSLTERLLAEAGLEGIELGETDSDRISLSIQGGRIELSPEQVARDIRALVSELNEEETTWTQ